MANIAIRKPKPGFLLVAGILMMLVLFLAFNGRSQKVSASHLTTIACNYGPTFELETSIGYVSMPDGNTLYSWGYNLAGEDFQYPGPTLCVDEGDIVTITLTNTLSVPSSLLFRGQTGVSASGDAGMGVFTEEASAGGGTATYSFVAGNPGTYLYESGTDPYMQIEMGLFGALIVYPAMDMDPLYTGRHFAYNDVRTEYNPEREFLLLLHEMDPALRQAVERGEPFDITTKHDRYWTINGRANPDTLFGNDVPWLPHQPYGSVVVVNPYDEVDNPLPALVRYANAGLENHPFHPHGNSLRIVGRDGRPLFGPGGEDLSLDGFTTTVGSGQTYDLLATWYNLGDGDFAAPHPWDPTTNPLPTDLAGVPNSEVNYPGLYNQVDMEDGFYSGSPYLGYQDDRLVGAIPYNLCGEFYYPWHSHALQEIQNFDEGFGGMLTVWAILPPDCPE